MHTEIFTQKLQGRMQIRGYGNLNKSIYLSIYLSMAPQTFVGPCPLFQFLDLLRSR
jgi:hypothetical protein